MHRLPAQRSARMAPVVTAVLVAFATVVLLGPVTFGPAGHFDEGFIASGAMMVRRGWLPIRDFFVIYGPGQYYLTAAAFALFGESLATARWLHLLVLVVLALMVMAVTAVLCRGSRGWMTFVAAAFLLVARVVEPVSGYPVVLACAMLLCACLAFARWSKSGSPPLLVLASLAIGAAGLLRWDFGVYGLMALAAALLLRPGVGPRLRGDHAVSMAAALMPALACWAVLFAPLVLAADPGRWWREVPMFLLFDFKHWRNLDFVGPAMARLGAGLLALDAAMVASGMARIVFAAFAPAVAVLAAVSAWRHGATASEDSTRVAALVRMLVPLVLLLFLQMRVRAHWQQGFPAVVVALPLLAWLLHRWRPSSPAGRGGRALAPVLVCLAVVLLTGRDLRAEWQGQGWLARHRLDIGRAGPLLVGRDDRALGEWLDYVRAVAYVREVTSPSEAIYSGPHDISRLFVNDAMVYFWPSAVRRCAGSRWSLGSPTRPRPRQSWSRRSSAARCVAWCAGSSAPVSPTQRLFPMA